MVRGIISLDVGQCGIQFGNTVWQQYLAEHNIKLDGSLTPTDTNMEIRLDSFFDEIDSLYFPRSIMIDSEPDIIDNICNSKYSTHFRTDYMISGQESSANNCAKGYYTVGKQLMHQITDKIRLLADRCDTIEGFIMNHSVMGGTGSGVGALVLETLSDDYKKTSKIGYDIYDENRSTYSMQPYNALFSNYFLLEHTDISFTFDNKKASKLCRDYLHIRAPSVMNINCLLSKVVSGSTLSFRSDTDYSMGNSFVEMQNNLVVFPRFHFMISSFAPIVTDPNVSNILVPTNTNRSLLNGFMRDNAAQYNTDVVNIISDYCVQIKKSYYINDNAAAVQSISEMFFDPTFFTVSCDGYQVEEDKFMSVYTLYRGDFRWKELNATAPWIKSRQKVSFIEWCPIGWKRSMNGSLPSIIDNDVMISRKYSGTMIGNNVCISNFFGNRVNKKFDKLYSKKSFIEKYCANGMEQDLFQTYREELQGLTQDYLEVLSEVVTDDDNDEDEDEEDDGDRYPDGEF
eukprot:782938_1